MAKKLYGDLFSSLLTLSLSTGIYTVKRLNFNKDKKIIMIFCCRTGLLLTLVPLNHVVVTKYEINENVSLRLILFVSKYNDSLSNN